MRHWHYIRAHFGDALALCMCTMCMCYTEKATKAWHRQERQKQRHNQNHHQTNQATSKQPTNSTTNLCTKHPTHDTIHMCTIYVCIIYVCTGECVMLLFWPVLARYMPFVSPCAFTLGTLTVVTHDLAVVVGAWGQAYPGRAYVVRDMSICEHMLFVIWPNPTRSSYKRHIMACMLAQPAMWCACMPCISKCGW